MSAVTSEPTDPVTRQVMVDVHGVHKSFGPLEVLRGVDLRVRTGEVTVILGPSGSGKSTLLRTINHLEKVGQGWIAIDGELVGYRRSGGKLYELKEKDVLKQRTGIGFVFQNFNLFPHLTVLENLVEAPVSGAAPPAQGGRGHGPAAARAGRARGQGRRLSAATVRRPAAAGGHRPRARPRTEGAAVRRAHLGARPGTRR
ncbi:hypothetical protein SHIRM173S_13121 [Streptomyces hirsutus]